MNDIYAKWIKRDPQWETQFEETLLRKFCDYGLGKTQLTEARAKTFGAGYELIIIAFFIGLYEDKELPLDADPSKTKKLGWAIENWGKSTKGNRKAYPELIKYIFVALVSKTEGVEENLMKVDKGQMDIESFVTTLVDKMEKYINYGLHYLYEKLKEDPNCLYENDAFYKLFFNYMYNDLKK